MPRNYLKTLQPKDGLGQNSIQHFFRKVQNAADCTRPKPISTQQPEHNSEVGHAASSQLLIQPNDVNVVTDASYPDKTPTTSSLDESEHDTVRFGPSNGSDATRTSTEGFADEPAQKKRKQVHCFQNCWLTDKTLCYDEVVDLFWLRYDDEKRGMYCYLCRKHDTSQQGSYVWSRECSIRYRRNVVSNHGKSEMHLLAKERECLQRYSQFEQEIQKRKSVEHEVVIAAFKCACWIAEEDIAVSKYSSLIELVSRIGDDPLHMRQFGHTSFSSVREMITITGDVLVSKLIEQIGLSNFALLIDEVTDITVYQQVIMYLRYLHEGHIKTQFYRVERLKESATGANLADLVKIRFQRDKIDLTQLQFVGSDGAANMTGKKSGFVAQMKKENPHVVGIWCVNHRLALSVGDTVKSLQWLKRYEGTVQQINKLFEYSPEKTRKLEQISDQYEATFSSDRRKKFVRPAATRWTSHERANDAIYHGYEVLLQTLHYFTEEARVPDATAAGLYTFCRKYMFIGTVYILQTVLPIVGKLARLWQKDVLVFSEVKPLTRAAIDKLTTLKQTREPTLELRAEFEGSGRFSDGEIQFTDKNDAKLDQFYDTLLTELCENLESRLALTPFLEAFELFDPCRFPGVNDKQYGKDEISLLCTHYELDEEKTQDEWCNFRYKFESPPMSTKTTAGEVCEVVVQQRNVLGDEYPNLCKLAELALLIPMSNAWPERGASCLKRIKSRLRNRMKGDLLQAIMTIDLNHGAGDENITDSVTAWRNKPRRNVFGTAHREDIHDSTMQSLSELVDSLTAKHRELMNLVCYNDEQDADEDSVADKKEQ